MGDGDSLRRRISHFLPSTLRRNLTAKLLLLLVVGTVISGAVVVASYAAINDEITDQVRAQVESDTTVQATVYENWLTERWTTLNAMTDEPEMQHQSDAVLHQWLSAKLTGVSETMDSLHVVDRETGAILGSTDSTLHGDSVYAMGLDRETADGLLFISREPVQLAGSEENMTLIGRRSGDRLLIGAVSTNTSLVTSQAFDDATSSLHSLKGNRVLGTAPEENIDLPENVADGTHVDSSAQHIVGMHVIAHDVLDAQSVDEYDETTTVGTVVVTQTPKSEAFAVRQQITRYLFIALGLGIVLLIGTAAVSMRSVTADINRLSERARQVSEGSFDVDVSSHREDEIGTLYRSVEAMRDSLRERLQQVSRQKRETEAARDEAQQAREKLRQVIDLVPDPVFARNRDGDFLFANEATAQSYALSAQEVEGKRVTELAPDKEQAVRFHEEDLNVIESGEPLHIPEHEVEYADGEMRIHETTKIPYQPVGSSEDAVLGYARNVTELKERERKIEEREQKYRSLFEDTQNALMVFTRDGYLDCNQQALELFGVASVEEFVEYTPWELAPPKQPNGRDSKTVALEHIQDAFEDGDTLFEYTHQRADGTEFPAEVKISQFQYEGERVLHSLVRDITERKEDERRIEQQRDNLEILNKMVRHDIRNDLQVILGYAETLDARLDGDDEAYVEHVLSSARHAIEITSTARDVSEVMLDSESDLVPVRFRHVLESEIEDVRTSYQQAVVETTGPLPDVPVLADELLESVFRNLLKNAINHNDKEVPRVGVSATRRDGHVRLRVADNGPGIRDTRKEIIFEEGEQGIDSEGSGLGLYLVKTLTDQYGGEVWVEDRDGSTLPDGSEDSPAEEPEGAVFVVNLQIAEV